MREWEDRRIAAVREAAKRRVYPRGYTRPLSAIAPMLAAIAKARLDDPEKFAVISTRNLPKSVSQGKPAKTFRAKHAKRFDIWRKLVLARDGNKCRECESTLRLEAHHIEPLAQSKIAAFLPMNGVTLCRQCHKQTNTYAGKVSARVKEWNSMPGLRRSLAMEQILGRDTCLMRVIPHKWQAYETVGNYSWTPEGVLVIFVSDMGNEKYEYLVFLHEYIEALLCRYRNISTESIDTFDMDFERDRDPGDENEPGDAPTAPYHLEHIFATKVERMLADQLGVDWEAYDRTVLSLSK